ncbi:MAG: hypothetical protein GDA46_03075 [Bdellovibrionales bacterium]|nr:hypothetical protein [Bdellovibrionales bacterium]
MIPDAKIIYAQSRDIKSRTYLEYRRDMKQKAIAELEVLPWLKEQIRKLDSKASVEKSGADKFIWFLRRGGLTGKPDFIVKYENKKEEYIEFQYAKEELKAYDFKISKIAPKDRKLKKRVPKKDTKILYIIKPAEEFAILEPSWIMKHSKQTVAPAWGNTPVFRVPKEKLKEVLKKDKKLNLLCKLIDKKNYILDFQHKVIEIEKEKCAYLLEQVLDKEKVLKIIPKTLDGFFKVCFILSHLQKVPANASLWLIYLLSFLNQKLNSYKIFQIVYSLDFLYSKFDLKNNEINKLVEGINFLYKKLQQFSKTDGSFQSSKTIAPLEDTRYVLFTINIIEDLTQDILFYYGNSMGWKPIHKIYQTIPQVDKTFEFIKK